MDEDMTKERQEYLINEIHHQAEILATYGIKADVVDDAELLTLNETQLEEAADWVINQVYNIED